MTLQECLQQLRFKGFMPFNVTDSLHVESVDGKIYSTDEVRILDRYEYKFELEPISDSIIFTLETSDGCKGILIDGAGEYSDSRVNNFIASIKKNTPKLSIWRRFKQLIDGLFA